MRRRSLLHSNKCKAIKYLNVIWKSIDSISVEHALSWQGGGVQQLSFPDSWGPYPQFTPPRVFILLFSDISSFSKRSPDSSPSLSFSIGILGQRPWSNHFPRLLVFNTQCIIKQIPHPDREKIEQLIRLELSQFMAKLKRVPTMDKSRRGRKSMSGRTGVSLRFSRSARRWESVAGSCLIYTWFFFSSCPSCTFSAQFRKTIGIIWDGRSMSQSEALSIIICSRQPKRCPLQLYELPNKLPSLTTRIFLYYSTPLPPLCAVSFSAASFRV